MVDINSYKYVNSVKMADLLGVKAKQIRSWARQGKIPKLVLPNQRFVFEPDAVIKSLKANEGGRK